MITFASLVLEREPLQWADLPGAFLSWLQNAGLVALIGLLAWCIYQVLTRLLRAAPSGIVKEASPRLSIVYLGFALGVALEVIGWVFTYFGWERQVGPATLASVLLTLGGTVGLIAATIPALRSGMQNLRWRRIWALARLSMKEAVRGRVLWVFTIIALIFLFAGYFVSYKPEDQIRNYVLIVYYAMAPLFLLLAALLGSFSIPNDVTRQTIHTIVTKPVERYEIVLGRFLGYGILLTVALAGLTAVSLVYVARGITHEAAQESYKARVPIFGDALSFYGTADPRKAENVGREWDYRTYIRSRSVEGGGEMPKQYAIWSFNSVPAALGQRSESVPFEFTFDIFRMVKGEEGVFCTFTFTDGALGVRQVELAVDNMRQERNRDQARINAEASEKKAKATSREELDKIEAWSKEQSNQLDDSLITKYGVYEASGVPVIDYHTDGLKVPASLFKRISATQATGAGQMDGNEKPPAFKVLVNVGDDRRSRMQMVGVAKRDLYLLAAELPFWQNFFKGAIGLWLSVLLVLGLAVACSTYLSGIISLLCTLFLFGAGLVVDYVRDLAEGKVVGGGPTEAMTRILYHLPMAGQLEQTPATSLAKASDAVFRVLLGTTLKVIPDVTRYNLTEYVANGFDIPWGQVLFLDNVVPLLAYLLPWGLLAYYLINSREVANPS